MPYDTNKDLPNSVQNSLPQHAQDIYREAFNHAYEQYKDKSKRRGDESQEQVAHKVAWSAVEKKYHKVEGTWKEK